MAAPAKFLFDVDFAAGCQREPTITVSEHAAKLAEAEACARERGYAEGQRDAEAENGRRMASTLERMASGIDQAAGALKAIEARLECEAVEVAVAVARKLAPRLIEREHRAVLLATGVEIGAESILAPDGGRFDQQRSVPSVAHAALAAEQARLDAMKDGKKNGES